MPDDSSSDFKAAQARHVNQIRTEVALQKATGMSLGQVRSRLNDFYQRTVVRADNRPLPPAVQKAPGVPNNQAQSLPAKGFGMIDDGKSGGEGQVLGEVILIGVINGTAKYVNFNAAIGDDV